MVDDISRRRFAAAAIGATVLGLGGCTEPSPEGTPPASPDEEPPPGPVEDQNGDEEQTPGRGPAGGPGEEVNETDGNDTSGENAEGDDAAEDDAAGDGAPVEQTIAEPDDETNGDDDANGEQNESDET